MKFITIKLFLIVFIVLLVLNIGLQFWYFNDFHLVFDSQVFNNLLTPILTFGAVLIYGATLRTALNQNKVLLSQNIKPFFEKEIDALQLKGEKIQIELEDSSGEEIKLNAFTYVNFLNKTIVSLSINTQYHTDYEDFKKGTHHNLEWYTTKSYFNDLYAIYYFTTPLSEISFYYKNVLQLIAEINQSKLIEEDKTLLKRQLLRKILGDYMAFMSIHRKSKALTPSYLDIFVLSPNKIEYKLLHETALGDTYRALQDEYKKVSA